MTDDQLPVRTETGREDAATLTRRVMERLRERRGKVDPTAESKLIYAWFEAHPNQPMPEGRAYVMRLLDGIRSEAVRQALSELEEEVGGMVPPGTMRGERYRGWTEHRAAVIELIHKKGAKG